MSKKQDSEFQVDDDGKLVKQDAEDVDFEENLTFDE
jgi:hypothetical protein